MWNCDACGAEGEDHFQVCWRCGAPRGGLETAEDGGHWAAETVAPSEAPDVPPDPDRRTCLACGTELEDRGEVPLRIHGPEGWSLFREWQELGERLWKVEVWACPRCRRLELYERA